MRRLLPGRLLARMTALLMLPTVLVLAACDPDQLGTAAVVDGKTVTVDELQDLTLDYLRVVPGADKGAAQRQILNGTIRSRILAEVARERGVSVTASEAAQVRTEILSQLGSRSQLIRFLTEPPPETGFDPQAVPPRHIDRWVRDFVIFQKILQQLAAGREPTRAEVEAFNALVVGAASSVDVQLNPRYGTWEPNEAVVHSKLSGGLSGSVSELAEAAKKRK